MVDDNTETWILEAGKTVSVRPAPNKARLAASSHGRRWEARGERKGWAFWAHILRRGIGPFPGPEAS